MLTGIDLSPEVDKGGWGQIQLGVASCWRQEVGGASIASHGRGVQPWPVGWWAGAQYALPRLPGGESEAASVDRGRIGPSLYDSSRLACSESHRVQKICFWRERERERERELVAQCWWFWTTLYYYLINCWLITSEAIGRRWGSECNILSLM